MGGDEDVEGDDEDAGEEVEEEEVEDESVGDAVKLEVKEEPLDGVCKVSYPSLSWTVFSYTPFLLLRLPNRL